MRVLPRDALHGAPSVHEQRLMDSVMPFSLRPMQRFPTHQENSMKCAFQQTIQRYWTSALLLAGLLSASGVRADEDDAAKSRKPVPA